VRKTDGERGMDAAAAQAGLSFAGTTLFFA
jgi:hypothetical protein